MSNSLDPDKPTLCQVWSGSKLLANVMCRRYQHIELILYTCTVFDSAWATSADPTRNDITQVYNHILFLYFKFITINSKYITNNNWVTLRKSLAKTKVQTRLRIHAVWSSPLFFAHEVRFWCIFWYVRPAKPQISLRICVVWPEPLLVAWIFYDS